jgi:hypothetical protein
MPDQTNQAQILIETLRLIRHPEGGWYREVYRSEEIIGSASLPARFDSSHCFSTSIYYLLESGDISAFHRIKSDETWHFYLGSPVNLYILQDDGTLQKAVLGDNPGAGHVFQWTVSHGLWFGAEVSVPGSFALLGCTVSPGFEFGDLEFATPVDLEKYSRYTTLIRRLTRD